MNNATEQLESREAYHRKSWLRVSVLRVLGALLLATQFASSKDFVWVQQAGGTRGGAIFRVAVDRGGNCYAGGTLPIWLRSATRLCPVAAGQMSFSRNMTAMVTF